MKIRKCKKCKRQWGVSIYRENTKDYICPHCIGKEKRKIKKAIARAGNSSNSK